MASSGCTSPRLSTRRMNCRCAELQLGSRTRWPFVRHCAGWETRHGEAEANVKERSESGCDEEACDTGGSESGKEVRGWQAGQGEYKSCRQGRGETRPAPQAARRDQSLSG